MNIPEAKRDGRLVIRLLPIVIAGFDNAVDKESGLYLRQLARLVDKSFSEYSQVREFLLEEIKTKDKLAYRFEIINHLENCITALSGVGKILHRLENGLSLDKKKKLKRDLDIYKLLSDKTKKQVEDDKIWGIRNMVEHIDKEIYQGNFKDHLFLDTTDDYKGIGINGENISLEDLVKIIETYHQLVLEIFNGLPNRWRDGKYYHDEIPKK